MAYTLSLFLLFACLHFRCGAEMVMTEEEWSVQKVIRKYIPAYRGSGVVGSGFNDGPGQATSCGPPQAKINMTWTPKTVIIGHSLDFYLTMIAPINFSTGKGLTKLFMAGQSQPILEAPFQGGCTDLKKYSVHAINCPIKQNDTIKMHFSASSYTSQLITGHFVIEVAVTDLKNQTFACVKFDIVTKDPSRYVIYK